MSLISKVLGGLGARDAPGAKDYWVDDAKCRACYECEQPFGLLVRRHHCRICGRVFCAACTSNSVPPGHVAADQQQWLRVCNYCHRIRERSSSWGRQDAAAAAAAAGAESQGPAAAAGAASPAEGAVAPAGSGVRELGAAQQHGSSGDAASASAVAASAAAARRRHARRQRAVELARTSGSDGSLTWEVPPVLEPDFGAASDDNSSGPPEADGDGDGGAALVGALNGVHPLVATARRAFAAASRRHLRLLVEQLLRAEDVAAWREWVPVLERLAIEAAATVSPSAAAAVGELDPRHYVKMKRLPGAGPRDSSCIVLGVAARKNVAHRRMRTVIDEPEVLLLSGALEYHRVANRLSSFDTLLEQEREHLRVAVARLASVRPDVLLVERSVARAAQEELLARGISLVQHVKPELLERVARATGAKVVPSVEELAEGVTGVCSQFRIETLPLVPAGPTAAAAASAAPAAPSATAAPGQQPASASAVAPTARTLMVFDGCPRPLGCTVLLHGPDADELTRVKRAAKLAVLAAYHCGLEGALLSEQLVLGTAALAPPGLTSAELASQIRSAVAASAEPAHVELPKRLVLSMSPHAALWDEEEGGGGGVGFGLGDEHSEGPTSCGALSVGGSVGGSVDGSGSPKGRTALQDEQQDDGEQQQQQQQDGADAPADLRPLAASGGSGGRDGSGTPLGSLMGEGSGEFTDPLRRRTPVRAAAPPGSDSEAAAPANAPETPTKVVVEAEARPSPSPWLGGLAAYERQRLFLSMACRNPRKQLLCEPPSVKRIDFYACSDLSLAGFIVAAAPHAAKKCQAPGCGDGVTAHVRTFLHGDSRLTLSVATLPAADALPGADRGQIWVWARPKGLGPDFATRQVRRLPLSPEASCISFGAFLQACFSASRLEVRGHPLTSGFVRYLGLGRTVMCLHQDQVQPSDVLLPSVPLRYSLNAQLLWLKQEAAELCQESHEAFDSLERVLKAHPYFQQQAAAAMAATQQQQQQQGTAAAAPGGDGVDCAGGPDPPSPLSNAAAMLSALRKDRSSFMDKVADTVARGTPSDLAEVSGARRWQLHTGAGPANAGAAWDEQLMSALQELNQLRRSLAITSLTWAATLQEPTLFVQTLQANALTAAAAAAAATSDPSPPNGAGAAVDGLGTGAAAGGTSGPSSPGALAAALAAQQLGEALEASANSASMFHLPSSLVASKIAVPPPQAAGGPADGGPAAGGGSVPIMPTHGPIAVQAVADLVSADLALASGCDVGATSLGGLLEGSSLVLTAVAQRAPDGDASGGGGGVGVGGAHGLGRVGSSGSLGSPRRSGGGVSASPGGPESPSRLRTMAVARGLDNGAAASDEAPASEDGEDGEVSHERFVSWLGARGGDDGSADTDAGSECFPELSDGEDGGGANGGSGAAGSLRADRAAGAEAGASRDGRGSGNGGAAPAGGEPSLPVPVPLETLRRGSSGGLFPGTRPSRRPEPGRSRAGLAAVTAMAASPGAGGAAVGPGGYACVALPGRALMPSGIGDSVVPIFDNEPTSVVAYFLSTRAYQQHLNAAMKAILQQAPRGVGGGGGGGGLGAPAATIEGQQQQQQQAAGSSVAPVDGSSSSGTGAVAAAVAATAADTRSAAAPPVGSASGASRPNTPPSQQPAVAESLPAPRGLCSTGTADAADMAAGPVVPSGQQQQQQQAGPERRVDHGWLSLLLSPEPAHVRHSFEDDSPGTPWLRARFQVTAYYAPQFAELRRRVVEGGEAAFIASLCRCRKWASRGGKSNAYFAKTRDDRFIVKSLSKQEKASFLEFAPAYFAYMARSMRAGGRPTCLAKIAGVYSITVKSTAAAQQSQSAGGGAGASPYRDGAIDVVVMENIFYDREISRIYDLKGSERSRFNADAAANPHDSGEVHLDDNLRRANLQAPILVEQPLLRPMEDALWRDTAFLSALGVMDYSLLVGVDRTTNTLVVAIIDFIRQYTWDKQLETWVKSTGILGGAGKEPTIISPKQYCRRFRSAISSYFTVVPGDGDVEPPLDPEA